MNIKSDYSEYPDSMPSRKKVHTPSNSLSKTPEPPKNLTPKKNVQSQNSKTPTPQNTLPIRNNPPVLQTADVDRRMIHIMRCDACRNRWQEKINIKTFPYLKQSKKYSKGFVSNKPKPKNEFTPINPVKSLPPTSNSSNSPKKNKVYPKPTLPQNITKSATSPGYSDISEYEAKISQDIDPINTDTIAFINDPIFTDKHLDDSHFEDFSEEEHMLDEEIDMLLRQEEEELYSLNTESKTKSQPLTLFETGQQNSITNPSSKNFSDSEPENFKKSIGNSNLLETSKSNLFTTPIKQPEVNEFWNSELSQTKHLKTSIDSALLSRLQEMQAAYDEMIAQNINLKSLLAEEKNKHLNSNDSTQEDRSDSFITNPDHYDRVKHHEAEASASFEAFRNEFIKLSENSRTFNNQIHKQNGPNTPHNFQSPRPTKNRRSINGNDFFDSLGTPRNLHKHPNINNSKDNHNEPDIQYVSSPVMNASYNTDNSFDSKSNPTDWEHLSTIAKLSKATEIGRELLNHIRNVDNETSTKNSGLLKEISGLQQLLQEREMEIKKMKRDNTNISLQDEHIYLLQTEKDELYSQLDEKTTALKKTEIEKNRIYLSLVKAQDLLEIFKKNESEQKKALEKQRSKYENEINKTNLLLDEIKSQKVDLEKQYKALNLQFKKTNADNSIKQNYEISNTKASRESIDNPKDLESTDELHKETDNYSEAVSSRNETLVKELKESNLRMKKKLNEIQIKYKNEIGKSTDLNNKLLSTQKQLESFEQKWEEIDLYGSYGNPNSLKNDNVPGLTHHAMDSTLSDGAIETSFGANSRITHEYSSESMPKSISYNHPTLLKPNRGLIKKEKGIPSFDLEIRNSDSRNNTEPDENLKEPDFIGMSSDGENNPGADDEDEKYIKLYNLKQQRLRNKARNSGSSIGNIGSKNRRLSLSNKQNMRLNLNNLSGLGDLGSELEYAEMSRNQSEKSTSTIMETARTPLSARNEKTISEQGLKVLDKPSNSIAVQTINNASTDNIEPNNVCHVCLSNNYKDKLELVTSAPPIQKLEKHIQTRNVDTIDASSETRNIETSSVYIQTSDELLTNTESITPDSNIQTSKLIDSFSQTEEEIKDTTSVSLQTEEEIKNTASISLQTEEIKDTTFASIQTEEEIKDTTSVSLQTEEIKDTTFASIQTEEEIKNTASISLQTEEEIKDTTSVSLQTEDVYDELAANSNQAETASLNVKLAESSTQTENILFMATVSIQTEDNVKNALKDVAIQTSEGISGFNNLPSLVIIPEKPESNMNGHLKVENYNMNSSYQSDRNLTENVQTESADKHSEILSDTKNSQETLSANEIHDSKMSEVDKDVLDLNEDNLRNEQKTTQDPNFKNAANPSLSYGISDSAMSSSENLKLSTKENFKTILKSKNQKPNLHDNYIADHKTKQHERNVATLINSKNVFFSHKRSVSTQEGRRNITIGDIQNERTGILVDSVKKSLSNNKFSKNNKPLSLHEKHLDTANKGDDLSGHDLVDGNKNERQGISKREPSDSIATILHSLHTTKYSSSVLQSEKTEIANNEKEQDLINKMNLFGTFNSNIRSKTKTPANDEKDLGPENHQSSIYEFNHIRQTDSGDATTSNQVSKVFDGPEVQSSNTPDPLVVQAIARTMVGSYMYKFSSKQLYSDIKGNPSKYLRYVWIHPYTKALNWSRFPPDPEKRERTTNSVLGIGDILRSNKTQTVFIGNVVSVTDKGNFLASENMIQNSIIISSKNHSIKLKAPTFKEHEQWFLALSYLQTRRIMTNNTIGNERNSMLRDNGIRSPSMSSSSIFHKSIVSFSNRLSSNTHRDTYESITSGLSMKNSTGTGTKKTQHLGLYHEPTFNKSKGSQLPQQPSFKNNSIGMMNSDLQRNIGRKSYQSISINNNSLNDIRDIKLGKHPLVAADSENQAKDLEIQTEMLNKIDSLPNSKKVQGMDEIEEGSSMASPNRRGISKIFKSTGSMFRFKNSKAE
ncbi:hypothetical protein BB559_003738 [Furculomyces boomerangus]|uniref:Pleckstrin homology domain-containing protein n=1 Tax=Furculomyces boomerangus TaxID=61424 RepID=A0A2T9YJ56_9FUNG|nr:hypothetical protein BB559_003738 [Furculomyces boomerangus]